MKTKNYTKNYTIWLLTVILIFLASCGEKTRDAGPKVQTETITYDSQLWVGTSDGLFHTNLEGELLQMPVPSFTHHPYPSIHALTLDSATNRLWIGAWNHLYCYDLQRERFVTINDSTIYRTVALQCDTLGRVLAWTERGLFRLTLNDSLPEGMAEQIDNKYYAKKELSATEKYVFDMASESSTSEYLWWLMGVICLTALLVLWLIIKRKKPQTGPDPCSSQPMQSPSQPEIPRPSFLEQACKVVDAHLADEDFTPEMFAGEMAVSRAQLFRKLKAANGQTVMEFITERRLALAIKLLTTTDRTIADVATACGFADDGSFRRTFHRKFGITPSNYREKSTINK